MGSYSDRETFFNALRRGDVETVRLYSPPSGNFYSDLTGILSSGLLAVQTFLTAFPSSFRDLSNAFLYLRPDVPDYSEIFKIFSSLEPIQLSEAQKASARRQNIMNAILYQRNDELTKYISEGAFDGQEGQLILTNTLQLIAQASNVNPDILRWLVQSGA